jgi:hypothetical protein
VQSRHHNLIAFSVDVGLLLKVLHSARSNDTDRLEAKLVQKSVRVPGQDEPEPKPFMSFTARVGGPGGWGQGRAMAAKGPRRSGVL